MEEREKSGHRKRGLSVLQFLIFLLLATGCSSTFIVTKNGKGYYFGSTSEQLYKLMCASGDLLAILNDTGLSSGAKDALYRHNCVPAERSKERVREIYTALSPDQRRELRLAFQKHGYDINYLEC
ncbi:MAG: DUF3106 domain-containing protein [Alphaproteobacteria bacterium]|uniref:DUF3106 domain-containing protein n=1 Tax=Candidatus Nitrobium versatile TaxID=2884831 RepID=A0A953JC20_9BACT|nr:DUF3106 domain-containing protein [Candidatus Nitrobium versatile]